MAKRSKNVHYVNNQEFSQAVVSYVGTVKKAKEIRIMIQMMEEKGRGRIKNHKRKRRRLK